MATRKTAPKKTAPAKKPVAKRAPAKPTTTSAPEKRELTEKESLFVAEYMVDLNATQAYLRSHPGVAYSTASTNGIRLLGYAWIQDAIAAQRAKTFGRLEITRERVLLEAARLAFFDPRRMYRADGSPIPINELDDDTAACIGGMEVLDQYEGSGEDRVFVGQMKKYKVIDKNPAVERLFKHIGLFEKDNNQKTQTLAEAFGQFIGQLHGSGAGKMPIIPPKPRQAQEPDDRSTLVPKPLPKGAGWK